MEDKNSKTGRRPRRNLIVVATSLILVGAAFSLIFRDSDVRVDLLRKQLRGGGCLYHFRLYPEQCYGLAPTFFPLGDIFGVLSKQAQNVLGRQSDLSCRQSAAQCLGWMGLQAKSAVPDLIRALVEGPSDFDTGDGHISPLSAAATALGNIGDDAAIAPLGQAIASPRPCEASLSAAPIKKGCMSGVDAAATALAGFARRAHGQATILSLALEDDAYVGHYGSLSKAVVAIGDDTATARIVAIVRNSIDLALTGEMDTVQTHLRNGATAAGAIAGLPRSTVAPYLDQLTDTLQQRKKLIAFTTRINAYQKEVYGKLPSNVAKSYQLYKKYDLENKERAFKGAISEIVRTLGHVGSAKVTPELAVLLKESDYADIAIASLRKLGPEANGLEREVAAFIIDPPYGAATPINTSKINTARSLGVQTLIAIGTCEAEKALERLSQQPEEISRWVSQFERKGRIPLRCRQQ